MFRLLQLGSLKRLTNYKVDNVIHQDIAKITGIYRETHGSNVMSPIGTEYVFKEFHMNCTDNDEGSKCWYANDFERNNLMVLSGSRTIELYCYVRKTREILTINEDNIYRNGKLYYGSPAMISWDGSIYHRTISGFKGCVSINFTQDSYTVSEIKNPIEVKESHEPLFYEISK
tara:strand:- start:2827 stop:3345 length:519 start_codon:yes stop_codon:yes gene_type:complete